MPRLEMRNWQREIEDSGHKMTRKMQVFPEKKEKKRKKTSGREDRRYLLCWFTSRSSEFLRKKKRKKWKSSASWRDERQGGSGAKSRK